MTHLQAGRRPTPPGVDEEWWTLCGEIAETFDVTEHPEAVDCADCYELLDDEQLDRVIDARRGRWLVGPTPSADPAVREPLSD
jgi:hypothetical protein